MRFLSLSTFALQTSGATGTRWRMYRFFTEKKRQFLENLKLHPWAPTVQVRCARLFAHTICQSLERQFLSLMPQFPELQTVRIKSSIYNVAPVVINIITISFTLIFIFIQTHNSFFSLVICPVSFAKDILNHKLVYKFHGF